VLRAAFCSTLLIVRRGQWGGVRRGKGGFPEVNIRSERLSGGGLLFTASC